MNEEDIVMLSKVLNTLNLISVNGKDDLDRMLGCIQALERVIAKNNAPADEKGE